MYQHNLSLLVSGAPSNVLSSSMFADVCRLQNIPIKSGFFVC
jgi:hypothetical protein